MSVESHSVRIKEEDVGECCDNPVRTLSPVGGISDAPDSRNPTEPIESAPAESDSGDTVTDDGRYDTAEELTPEEEMARLVRAAVQALAAIGYFRSAEYRKKNDEMARRQLLKKQKQERKLRRKQLRRFNQMVEKFEDMILYY
jgi:hypothetical protein